MYSKEFKTKVVNEIIAGLPIKRAARTYNIERHTVQNWVRSAGITVPARKQWITEEQKLEAIKQVETGISVRQVAETFNVAEQTIYNWIRNKKHVFAVYSIQRRKSETEGTEIMPRSTDEKDIKLQNRSLKEENEFLRAKVAYLEELMKLNNLSPGNFKKKLDMKPSTEQLNEKQEV